MDFVQIIAAAQSDWARRRAAGCEGIAAGRRCAAQLRQEDGYLCARCEGIEASRARTQGIAEALDSIPARYRWAKLGFATAPAEVAQGTLARLRKATAPAREALAEVRSHARVGVTIRGGSRRGKTALACAMQDAAARDGATGALFVSARALARSCTEHGFGKGAPPAFTAALDAPLLVLDDVGSERGSASQARDYVSDLLDERINAGLETIITTWHTEATAAAMYGGGISARLFQDFKVIDLGEGPTS